ncbi:MAG: hypothetical protein MUC63_01860, partial [Planctomycetes bacterium]|nr:hypothetical protein [Planctomycetota bacterium]
RSGALLADLAALGAARRPDLPGPAETERLLGEARGLASRLGRVSPSDPRGDADGLEPFEVAAAAEALASLPREGRLACLGPEDFASLGRLLLALLRGAPDLTDAERTQLCLALALLGETAEAQADLKARYPKPLRAALPPAGLARIATVLKAAADPEAAEVAAELRDCVPLREGRLHFLRLAAGDGPDSDPVAAAGLALRALAPFPAGDPLPDALFLFLMDNRRGSAWGDSYRTGMAAAGLAAVAGPASPASALAARMNSAFEAEFDFDLGPGRARFGGECVAPGANRLALDAGEGSVAFWTLEGRAEGRRQVSGEVRAEVQFTALEAGNGTWKPAAEPSRLRRGAPVEGAVFVLSERNLEDVLVSVPLPAGFAPLDEWRVPTGRPLLPPGCAADFGAGCVRFHLRRLPAAKPLALRFVALAAWKGKFALPPVAVDRVGDGAIGYGREGKLEIVDAAE